MRMSEPTIERMGPKVTDEQLTALYIAHGICLGMDARLKGGQGFFRTEAAAELSKEMRAAADGLAKIIEAQWRFPAVSYKGSADE